MGRAGRRVRPLFAAAMCAAASACAPEQQPDGTPVRPSEASEAGRHAVGFRAPAVPLFVHDPYWNMWSASSHPGESWPIHWNGAPRPVAIAALVDGTPWRLVGAEPAAAALMPLERTEVWPLRTLYYFRQAGLSLVLTLREPEIPEERAYGPSLLPGTLVDISGHFDDGAMGHRTSLYIEMGGAMARADAAAPIEVRQIQASPPAWGLTASATPATERVYHEQDELPDWGTLVLVGNLDEQPSSEAGPAAQVRGHFLDGSTLRGLPQERLEAARADDVVLALAVQRDGADVHMQAFAGHAREQRVKFGDVDCTAMPPQGESLVSLVGRAFTTSPTAMNRETQLLDDAWRFESAAYRDLLTLAWRQTFGAIEWCNVGEKRYGFMKELASGSLVQTVDVILPAAPALVAGNALAPVLEPFLDWQERGGWKAEWPPHDLGIYPVVEDDPHFPDTPVETAGDLLLLVALASDGLDTRMAEAHEPLLRRWADYLVKTGIDPPEQLSTDDFTGTLAHNGTLGLKAALAVGAFAVLEERMGHAPLAGQYRDRASAMCADWVQRADAGDHFKLALDEAGSYSLKYNLLFDRLLGLGCVPEALVKREIAWYLARAKRYGSPLESRFPWAKVDWLAWVGALGTPSDLNQLLAPVERYLDETSDRVPFTDLYDADTGKRTWAFQARPVVGALYAPILVAKRRP